MTQAAPRRGHTHADVLVIGGGAIGLAISWRLARTGMSVRICDPNPGRGASWVAAGMLAPINETHFAEDDRLPVALAALRAWPGFAAELQGETGKSVGLRREGSLAVAFDSDDRGAIERMRSFHSALGLAASALTTRECRDLEPWLSPEIAGGTNVADDLSVDNRALVAALLTANQLPGISVDRRRVRSMRLSPDDSRVTGITLDDGEQLDADTVVLAAGAWSMLINGLPAAALARVHPRKGQILRLRKTSEQPQPLTRSIVALVQGSPVYLVPRASGELVVGATQEDKGFDTTVTAGGVWELLRDAHRVVPAISEMHVTDMSAGLRPATPDNAALVGRTSVDGLLMATGHGRNGILFAPLSADIITGLLTGSDPTPEESRLDPMRFNDVNSIEPATWQGPPRLGASI